MQKIPLKTPVTEGKKTITEVALKRPLAIDLIIADDPTNPLLSDLLLLGRVSGLLQSTLECLDGHDFLMLNAQLKTMQSTPPTQGQSQYDEISLRRPTAMDIVKSDHELRAMNDLLLLTRISGLKQDDIETMDGYFYVLLVNRLADLLKAPEAETKPLVTEQKK